MLRFAKGFLWLWALALPRLAAAQSRPTHVTVVLPSHIQVGNQFYDASVGGLEDYLADLRLSDPASAAAFAPEVDALRVRRNAAWGIAIGGGAVGFGLMALSATTFATHEVDSFGLTQKTPNWTVFAIGGSLACLGPLVGLAIVPRRGDFLEVVNRHNRLRPGSPMSIQLGLGGPGGPGMTAVVTF